MAQRQKHPEGVCRPVKGQGDRVPVGQNKSMMDTPQSRIQILAKPHPGFCPWDSHYVILKSLYWERHKYFEFRVPPL